MKWQNSAYFCPLGCSETNDKVQAAQHLLGVHTDEELKPWLYTRKVLEEFLGNRREPINKRKAMVTAITNEYKEGESF